MEVPGQGVQGAGGGNTGRALLETVVVIQDSQHKRRLWIGAASEGVGQAGAESQTQPLEDEAEFPAEAAVNPEVEDAVEETVRGWKPYHHKLHPLWYTAT